MEFILQNFNILEMITLFLKMKLKLRKKMNVQRLKIFKILVRLKQRKKRETCNEKYTQNRANIICICTQVSLGENNFDL